MACVTLTHFINPHLFWCYKVDVPNNNYAKICQEEEKLESLYDDKFRRRLVSQLTVGAKVTVKYLLWRKLIRATVLEVVNDTPYYGEYIVWAIDYGFPLQTKMEYIRLLPESSDLTIDQVICAGIANVQPAEKFYNMLTLSYLTEPKIQWSQRACEELQKKLLDATCIVLVENFTLGSKCWGDLEITDFSGHKIIASEFLLKLEAANPARPDFRNTCYALSTTEIISLWASNKGSKVKENICPNSDQLPRPILAHERKDFVDQMTRQKIQEWRSRNIQVSDESLNQHEQHDSETDDGVFVDEITCEDSVSVKNLRGNDEATNMDDHELGGVIGMSVALLNLRNMHVPDPQQLPSLCAFEFNAPPKVETHEETNESNAGRKYGVCEAASDLDDQLSQATGYTEAMVARTQRLLEQKRNIRLKQLTIKQTDVSSKPSQDACTENDKMHTRQNTVGQVEQAPWSTQSTAIRTAAVAASPPMDIASSSADSRVRQQQFELTHKYHNQQKGQTPSNFSDRSNEQSTDKKSPMMHPSLRLAKIRNPNSVLFEKVPIEMPQNNASYPNFSEIAKGNEQQPIYHEVNCLPMIPAGFDVTRLSRYKNESNHWHRKVTTVNEKAPDKKGTIRKPFDAAAEQDFRFSRGHRDKNKNTADDTDAKCIIGKPITKPLAISTTPLLSLKEVDDKSMLRTHLINHLVLAHSKVPLQSLTNCTQPKFAPQIQDRMSLMKISEVFRVQAYAWPHLLRGNSLVTVNPKRSGKTWTYLPALCNLVGFRTIKKVPKKFGPVAIVLVATSKCAEYVTDMCQTLMRPAIVSGNAKSEMSVVSCFGVRKLPKTKLQLFHGCGILVATPSSLLQLLRDNAHQSLIDPARLQMLVIDDLDQMMARTSHEFKDVLRQLFKIAPKTANGILVPQLVIMSCLWDPTLMVELLKRCHQPLLLIGDHLEAALYGQATLYLKFEPGNKKLAAIRHFIQEDPRHSQSLLIMCSHDSDVVHVVQMLAKCGYSCIGYTSQSRDAERDIAMEWKMRLNLNQILVCTDENLPELELQTAQSLIHYSFPMSWRKFTSRFAALLSAYENRIANGFAASCPDYSARSRKSEAVKSLILFDEESCDQLPRLVDFLHRHNLEQSLPPEISSIIQNVLNQREDCRSAQGALMCPGVLEFGYCHEPQCPYRHNLMRSDKIPPSEDIPGVGELRVHILKVFSPCHYAGRLLQHKAPGATEWRNLRQSNVAGVFTIKLSMYYSNAANRMPYWPPKVNDLCIHRTGEGGYQRARIIEVPSIQETNMVQTVKICLKQIDVGTIEVVKSDDLFVCADQFRDFPPLAVEMRLSGVRPFDSDRTWDPESLRSVTKWIMTDITENDCVHVSIDFALINTVWVRSIIVMERLPTLGRYIYRVDVKNLLLKMQMAERCPSDSNGIYDIALKNKLIDDGTWNADELNAKTTSDCQDDNSVAADCTSACSQQLSPDTGLEDTANKTVDKRDDILGDLPKMRLTEPVESCAVATPDNVKRTTNSTETWCTLREHEMQLVRINAVGDWSEIYLRSLDFMPFGRSYEKLVALIKEHVERQKTDARKHRSLLLPMQNCILKYREVYSRAKLYSVCDAIHRFFLCDYGTFVEVHVLKLWRDCVYETNEEIIAYAPYNAIHCTMAGIDFRHCTDRERKTAFSKTFQYVYAVGENTPKTETDSVDWHKLGMRSYKVLLYECDKRDDFTDATMLNKVLLERGAASRDPDTEHFLTHSPGVKFGGFNLIDPRELVKCFARSCELDGDNDGAEFAKQLLMFNDLNQTTKQAMTDNEDKQKKQPIIETAGDESKKSKTPNEYSSPEESTSTSCEGGESSKSVPSTSAPSVRMPHLISSHKCPPTIWYETKCLIFLKIHAPDVDDYYLSVNADMVHFKARVNGEQRELVLNLLGTVEPQYTTQKIRGLNVVVQLVKSVYMKWPRLLSQSTKFAWLTYDLNALDLMEEPQLPPLDTKPIHPNQIAIFHNDEEDSADNNNDENEFDPTQEIL